MMKLLSVVFLFLAVSSLGEPNAEIAEKDNAQTAANAAIAQLSNDSKNVLSNWAASAKREVSAISELETASDNMVRAFQADVRKLISDYESKLESNRQAKAAEQRRKETAIENVENNRRTFLQTKGNLASGEIMRVLNENDVARQNVESAYAKSIAQFDVQRQALANQFAADFANLTTRQTQRLEETVRKITDKMQARIDALNKESGELNNALNVARNNFTQSLQNGVPSRVVAASPQYQSVKVKLSNRYQAIPAISRPYATIFQEGLKYQIFYDGEALERSHPEYDTLNQLFLKLYRYEPAPELSVTDEGKLLYRDKTVEWKVLAEGQLASFWQDRLVLESARPRFLNPPSVELSRIEGRPLLFAPTDASGAELAQGAEREWISDLLDAVLEGDQLTIQGNELKVEADGFFSISGGQKYGIRWLVRNDINAEVGLSEFSPALNNEVKERWQLALAHATSPQPIAIPPRLLEMARTKLKND